MTQFLSAHSDKPPRQFQPQVIHGLFFGLFGAAFCQVKVYCRADQRMFLAIGEAIAVQQIGLFPLGQPFASRRISMSTSGRAARIRAIVRRRSEVWYIQIKFSSSTLKFMVKPLFRVACCGPLPFSGWRPVLFRKTACGRKHGACGCPCPGSPFCQPAHR